MADRDGKKVEDIVAEHDEKMRRERQLQALSDAKSLTNGDAGNDEKIGKVLLYLVEEEIDTGKVVRAIANTMKDVQFKADCALNHATPMGKFTIWGMSFRLPLVVAMILWFVWSIYQDQMKRVYQKPIPAHFEIVEKQHADE